MSMWDKLVTWNKQMGGVPRKLCLICIVLLCAFLFIWVFPLVWPFVLALVFAVIMDPLVKLLRKAFVKIPGGKAIATGIGMVILFGLISWITIVGFGRIIRELLSLAKSVPDMIRWISIKATEWVTQLTTNYAHVLPEEFPNWVNSALNELSKTLINWGTSVSGSIASGAFSTAISLPSAILSIVVTVMGTFYFSSDRERIFHFFRTAFPKPVVSHALRLKTGIFRALFGQIKSQILVSVLITGVMMAGLLIQQKPYGLLLGLIIGVADALPIVGAGLFLIPWSISGFVLNDMATGIGMALLYLATIIVRQVAEPRIVGKTLGVYPLAVMMSMFAGFQLVGFWGMLGGPVLLNICRVVLEADSGLPLKPAAPPFKFHFKKK